MTSFIRTRQVLRWLVDRDTQIYLYVYYSDRVDVLKFERPFLRGNKTPVDDLISVTEPEYRVVGYECSCPGFQFRNKCRHRQFIESEE